MPSAFAVRLQIESELANRIPSALTPAPKMLRPVMSTGIGALDDLLRGGLPIGAITELVGPECSGRTSVATSFLARITQANKVCAWIDVSNTFDPLSAAAVGLDLRRLLWVRCGTLPMQPYRSTKQFTLPEQYLIAPAKIKGLHGGGGGSHPRSEIKGLSEAISGLARPSSAKPQVTVRTRNQQHQAASEPARQSIQLAITRSDLSKPWARVEQALRTADLLLQAGGFAAIVLDMASLPPEVVSRVPLATWHRYRMASERTQSSFLLMTQHSCAKSSAELLLLLHSADPICDASTVFTGIKPHVEVARQRFTQTSSNVIPLRKPPQGETSASWQCRTPWAGAR